jgi:hypothetical protein
LPLLYRLRCALGEWEGLAWAASDTAEACPDPAGAGDYHRGLPDVLAIEERGRDLFDAAERLDVEGVVAQRKADLYRPETVWYKIKSRT